MRTYAVFTVHADARDLADLRRGVRHLMGGDEAERNRELLLAIHELVANAILHGSGLMPVLVCVAIDDDRVSATIADNGGGFDVARLVRQWPPPADAERGRGIYLATRLVDSLSIDAGAGTVVHVMRHLKQEGDRTRPVCVRASPTYARFSHAWLLRQDKDELPKAS
jgi:anti-sigma regulatory factor (Ser/Thr protein kinase)